MLSRQKKTPSTPKSAVITLSCECVCLHANMSRKLIILFMKAMRLHCRDVTGGRPPPAAPGPPRLGLYRPRRCGPKWRALRLFFGRA